MKDLIAIPPMNVQAEWPKIRADIASVETPDGAIPEEVYFAIKSNQATLFYMMQDGVRIGHMVVRLLLPDLHLWQVKADNGFNVLAEFREQLMGLARQAGASFITYGSARGAWDKVGPKHGFAPRMTIWQAPVDPAPEQLSDSAKEFYETKMREELAKRGGIVDAPEIQQ